MASKHCKECGTDFEDSLKECPTCGCPASYAEEVRDAAQQTVAQIEDEQDFNEHYEYSPFREDSWFTRVPWPLSRYPRRAFANKHPFLGWLFDPWHLTCRDESKREQYDTINNIFYLFNLIFKANFYAACWTFLKLWLIYLLFYVGSGLLTELSYDYYSYEVHVCVNWFIRLCFIILVIVTCITFCFGVGNALHRYWPSFHKTWRRVNKRYWKAMKE